MESRKKVLFLTHYFPPEVNAPASRTFEHCRLWAKDADVTVITNFPNHPDGALLKGYKNRLYQKEFIDGIQVIRLWTLLTPNKGFALRTLNFIVYMIMSIAYVMFSFIKFDVVIATSPQFFCGLAGKYIAKLRHKRFILEIRDLWPESIVAVGALNNKLLIHILERIELGLYKSAYKIVAVTNSFRQNMIARGIVPSKIHVLFNGVSFDTFVSGKPVSDVSLHDYLEDGFKIGYIGTIGLAHSISTLIDAAERLSGTTVRFVIVGSGAEREELEKRIALEHLTNIKIFPLQPKDEIPSIINSLDLFCVHLKKEKLFSTVIPSKMFEGMAMHKPILMGVDGEARCIVEESGCGEYFEPQNADDLVNKILLFYNRRTLMKEYGARGYKFVVENFDRKKIAHDYLNLITAF